MAISQGRGGDGFYRKRGIWYFSVPTWNGRSVVRSSRTKVLSEARAVRKRILESQAESSIANPERRYMREMLKEREELHCARLAPRTRQSQICRLKTISRIVGEIRLGAFTLATMERYQATRLQEKGGVRTINLETSVMRTILDRAGMLSRIRGYKPLKPNTEVGRKWTKEEIDAVMTEAANGRHPWYLLPALSLAFQTGMRHKEIRTLRRRNIDLERGCLVVERSMTKTKTGQRIVPLTRTAKQIASEILKLSEILGSTRSEHFVFAGWDQPHRIDPTRSITSFLPAWTKLKKAAKVDHTLRIHDIRHHVASDLAETSLTSAIACEVLGWTSAEMRMHYEHLQSNAWEGALDGLEGVRRLQGWSFKRSGIEGDQEGPVNDQATAESEPSQEVSRERNDATDAR
jgi:integrase